MRSKHLPRRTRPRGGLRPLPLSGAAVLLLLLAAAPRAAARTAVMPLDEVQPGQRGTGRTVFEGGAPGEFDLEVLGIQRGGMGPRRDLIIVRLLGDRLAHTGVVAGMSGTPVTIDGRLVGALSFRIGTFAKEPIAGVTPFAYMQEIPAESGATAAVSWPSPGPLLARGRDAAAAMLLPAPRPAGLAAGAAVPIAPPLLVAGADTAVLDLVGPSLRAAGWVMQAGGSAAASPPAPGALRPGDAVGALLLGGDLKLAATGTVTAVEDGRVLAFGHPFLRAGATRLPMTRVEVLTTVASQLNSYKLANVGDVVGTFDQDRVSGIAGRLGEGPELVPVEVVLRPRGHAERRFHFEMIDHPVWSPFLAQVAVLTSALADVAVGEEVTAWLTVTLHLEDLGPVRLHEAYAQTGPGTSPLVAAAGDVGRVAAALLANRFRPLRPQRLQVSLELDDGRRYWLVQGAQASHRRARAGEEIVVAAVLAPYRGEPRVVRVPLKLPRDLPPGPLELVVGGAQGLDRVEAGTIAARMRQLGDVSDLRDFIAELRSSDRLYVMARRTVRGGLVGGRQLPALPGSALQVLSGDRSGFVPTATATVAGASQQVDGVVLGASTITVEVLPASPDAAGP